MLLFFLSKEKGEKEEGREFGSCVMVGCIHRNFLVIVRWIYPCSLPQLMLHVYMAQIDVYRMMI